MWSNTSKISGSHKTKSVQTVDLNLDVTKDISDFFGEKAHIAVTIHLPAPEKLSTNPIVCFAKPGGAYCRKYYTHDLPGPTKETQGAQAVWHAERGWIFVSVDHLGVGESSLHDGDKLTYTPVAAANHYAEQEVLARLAKGGVVEGYPKIEAPVTIGIGQSMGGCLTIIQQGRYHCYDGIAALGFSAVHTHVPTRPGELPMVAPWVSQSQHIPPAILNHRALEKYVGVMEPGANSGMSMAWCFHYDDVSPDLIVADFKRFNPNAMDAAGQRTGSENSLPWASLTAPVATAKSCLTPGAVAPEAAAIVSPVLVAVGERDVIADLKGEPRAYLSASSVDLFVCPRMGHMHNFAGTRELFWKRIETWAEWVRELKAWG
ncbi:hypothetical protein K432DRAFT_429709 [Lepidopterella palustris CBS 459.81]|uniref:Alpha/beta-hydrolase n=1 Tax=Lepidopterella palustris CBS 459.81 TaxID=1314670 RepID=A0A8E2E0E2_9PEZI|nr:hypothetical protein K432DRAFT_429709 [Lepidopterella palustris CBS 459.81]